MLDRSVLVYDGQCSFCGIWLRYWQALCGDSVEYVALQELGDRLPELDRETLSGAAHLVTIDGTPYHGAQAILRLLAPTSWWPRLLLSLYEQVTSFAVVSDAIYAWIGRHRDFAYKATALLWGKEVRPQRYRLAEFVFLRLLGLVYSFAFLSLRPQITGLVGEHGIVPVNRVLQMLHGELGSRVYHLVPTLLWLSPTDQMLTALCGTGIVFAVLLLVNVVPRFSTLVCWVAYLSLATVGQPFTSFQWDTLLLESGFLALFAGFPWQVWMFRLLVFRLMFESGVVKLTSGDSTWRSLRALRFHFETQPLPNPFAYVMHHAPVWFLDSLTGWVLVIELGSPFLLFAPRRLRHLGAWLLIGLQLGIAASGNYAFFNLLSLALLLWAFEDQAFEWLPAFAKQSARKEARWSTTKWVRWPAAAVAVFIAFVGLAQVLDNLSPGTEPLIAAAENLIAPFDIVNHYGLFAVMTRDRPEIIFEGSNDGLAWQPYELPYKPSDVKRRLPIVAPLQPRLDWQLWFAAFGSPQQEPWTANLQIRLLQGEPDVLKLFSGVPFANPPKFVRAQRYDYRFTTKAERDQTGDIWKRQLLGTYLPAMSLESLGDNGR